MKPIAESLVRLSLVASFLLTTLCGQQMSWAKQSLGQPIAPSANVYGQTVVRCLGVAADGSSASAGWLSNPSLFGPGESGQTLVSPFTTASTYQAPGAFVSRHAVDGSLQWATAIRAVLPTGDWLGASEYVMPTGIGIASDGSSVVTGWYFCYALFGEGETNETTLPPLGNSSVGFQPTMFLARYASDGHLLWARRDGADGQSIMASSLAIADDGAVLVTGYYPSQATFGAGGTNSATLGEGFTQQMFLAKYDAAGAFVWAKGIHGGYAAAEDVAALPDGTCYVTGWFWHDASEPSLPVMGFGEANATALDEYSDYSAIFFAKYQADGSLAWARQSRQGSMLNSGTESIGKRMTVFADGSSALAGSFLGQLTLGVGEAGETSIVGPGDPDTTSYFVARYDAAGLLQWVRSQPQDRGNGSITCPDIAAGSDGTVLLAGNFLGAVVFGAGGQDQTTLISNNPADVPTSGITLPSTFVARLGLDGSFSWARTLPTTVFAGNGSICIGAAGEGAAIVATGTRGMPLLGPATVPQGTVTVAAGEPNATEITITTATDLLLVRLRGEVTTLTAATEPNGTNPVTVSPTDAAEAGDSDVELTFAGITAAGTTTAVVTDGEPTPPLPSAFQLAGQNQWYEISTTADYVAPIEICIDYDENGIADESALRLMHYEGGTWVDVTTSLDTDANRICGETSSLSPFAIVLRPPVSISATHPVISAFGGVTTLLIETEGQLPFVSTTAGVLLGAPLDQGDGRHFALDLAADGVPGTAIVTATAGGIQSSTNVRFVPVDPARSTITVDPAMTFLGGVVTVTVDLRDALGQAASGIGEVTITTSLGSLIGETASVGNGVYSRQLMADAIGTAQITAQVDGLVLDEPAALTVRDPSGLGSAFGLDASAAVFAYATIQEAVNRADEDHLVHIFVSPGTHAEIVKIADRHDLVLEALSGLSPVQVRGIRVDRCSSLALSGFVIDAAGSGAAGLTLAGGCNGNSVIHVTRCSIIGTGRGQAGVDVGPGVVSWSLLQCVVTECEGHGIQVAAAGPGTVTDCVINGCGWNGLDVGKDAALTVQGCSVTSNGALGDVKRGYGISRQRAPGAGQPAAITLVGNVLSGNGGLVISGRSTAQLGNYDQVLDPTDSQATF
ncbi:MAG: right-handed parallel beta-helix repeat-containing protein [Planctomycetes bacterium]|nr:right-handed parallel beta-helix repeat-containing protein [Planctomycetota bacterium]